MKERRMFERFKVDLPVRFLCKETQKSGEGKLLDISAGGGGLLLTVTEIQIKNHLDMWIDLKDGRDPIYITGLVVWIEETKANVFRLGIKFDEIGFMKMWRILDIIKK